MFASVASDFVFVKLPRSVKADVILESICCTGEVEMLDISKVSATEQKIWLASLKLSIWTWPVEQLLSFAETRSKKISDIKRAIAKFASVHKHFAAWRDHGRTYLNKLSGKFCQTSLNRIFFIWSKAWRSSGFKFQGRTVRWELPFLLRYQSRLSLPDLPMHLDHFDERDWNR